VYLTGHGWKLRQEQLKGQWLVRASSFLPLLIHSNFPIYIHSASGLGESSCQLFGYMGLDSSTDPRTDSFKLSFEEQTDKRVRHWQNTAIKEERVCQAWENMTSVCSERFGAGIICLFYLDYH